MTAAFKKKEKDKGWGLEKFLKAEKLDWIEPLPPIVDQMETYIQSHYQRKENGEAKDDKRESAPL